MFGLGMGELVVILLIVVLIFGVGKVAGMGKALGTAIAEFRAAVKEPERKIEPPDSPKNDNTPQA